MFFANNCEQYAYTKITVPLILLKSPSDYDGIYYYLDVNCDDFCQENCHIGTQKLEAIKLSRVKSADCEKDIIAEWNLETTVNGGKNEDEIISILDELCIAFSLKFIRYYKHFQNCGFEGFSYDRLRLERKYAHEDKIFSDNATSMYCGAIEVKSLSSINSKVFKLSKKTKTNTDDNDRLTYAFFRALKCKDKISRYILLYYLFEIMYGTDEYQALKKQYEQADNKNKCFKTKHSKNYADEKRSIILFQYLQQEFDLIEYSSFGKKIVLKAEVLERIISVRNDLTHRGDLSNVSELMYNHLIPILQSVIIKL